MWENHVLHNNKYVQRERERDVLINLLHERIHFSLIECNCV